MEDGGDLAIDSEVTKIEWSCSIATCSLAEPTLRIQQRPKWEIRERTTGAVYLDFRSARRDWGIQSVTVYVPTAAVNIPAHR